LAVAVVGKEEDFGEPLSALGKMTTVDVRIPRRKRCERVAKPL